MSNKTTHEVMVTQTETVGELINYFQGARGNLAKAAAGNRSATAPANPASGDKWTDISAAPIVKLKRWNGTKWVSEYTFNETTGHMGFGTENPRSSLHIKDDPALPDRIPAALPFGFDGLIIDGHANVYNGIYSYGVDIGCAHWHVGAPKDAWLMELDADIAAERWRMRIGGSVKGRPDVVFGVNRAGTIEIPGYPSGKSVAELGKTDSGKLLGITTDGHAAAVDPLGAGVGDMIVGKDWAVHGVQNGSIKRLASEQYVDGPLNTVTTPRVHIVLNNPQQAEFVWDIMVQGQLYDGKILDLRFGGRYSNIGYSTKDLMGNMTGHGIYKHSTSNLPVLWFEPGVRATHYSGFTVDSRANFDATVSTIYRAPATEATIHYTAAGATL